MFGRRVGVEARHLEIGRQRDLQHIDLLARRADRLRVGAAQRQAARLEIVPHRGVGERRLQPVGVETGDALQIGQRRHVHDRHARHPARRDRVEQFAHARRAVLRLLHRQRDEVEIGRLDVAGTGGAQAARQHFRPQLDRLLAAAHRQPDDRALAVERLDFGRKADHRDLMVAEQQLGGEQRPVGRPHDQHIVSGHGVSPGEAAGRKRVGELAGCRRSGQASSPPARKIAARPSR